MISIDPAVLSVIISFITLLALIGGGFFWLGKLGNRVSQVETRLGRVEDRVDEVDKKVDEIDKKVSLLTNKIDQVDQKIDLLAEGMRDLREEMRRGNQQLLIALANHGHDDDGQPVFRVPVSAE